MLNALDIRTVIFVLLAVTAGVFGWHFVRAIRRDVSQETDVRPELGVLAVSFVATFFDTLGIGSFATTTSLYRYWGLVADERLPGTLNVGYVIPTVVQAFVYMRLVPVDARTLALLIASSAFGAWLGAGVVATWPRRRIQLGMGVALLVASAIMILSQPQVGLLPSGGDVLGLSGLKLVVGIVGNFVLGALMTLGIGLYAPCMILVYLLGMAPTAAFPIMMGSCAFLMPVASFRFLKAGTYSLSAVVGMSATGIPAVLIAAFLVKSLPLTSLRWLVVVVVTYTAGALIRAGAANEPSCNDMRSPGLPNAQGSRL